MLGACLPYQPVCYVRLWAATYGTMGVPYAACLAAGALNVVVGCWIIHSERRHDVESHRHTFNTILMLDRGLLLNDDERVELLIAEQPL